MAESSRQSSQTHSTAPHQHPIKDSLQPWDTPPYLRLSGHGEMARHLHTKRKIWVSLGQNQHIWEKSQLDLEQNQLVSGLCWVLTGWARAAAHSSNISSAVFILQQIPHTGGTWVSTGSQPVLAQLCSRISSGTQKSDPRHGGKAVPLSSCGLKPLFVSPLPSSDPTSQREVAAELQHWGLMVLM